MSAIAPTRARNPLTTIPEESSSSSSSSNSSLDSYYNDLLFKHLLPGVKEEQLPTNLTKYDKGRFSMKKTYEAISEVVFGPSFFASIGVRAAPIGPIPQTLLEKKYLLTHTIKLPRDSKLGLSEDGKLTNDPEALQYTRKLGTLEFPNTPYNRDFIKNNGLTVDPYPMSSPLEQGSPLILFQKELEIDVPAGSPLQSVDGVLIEDQQSKSNVSETRTVKFLNTPHNWLTLAAPFSDPSRVKNGNDPCIAKYLNKNAQPVEIEFVTSEIKSIWDSPVLSEWVAPTIRQVTTFVPTKDDSGYYNYPKRNKEANFDEYTYAQSVEEAEAIGSHPLTFQQVCIHRILTQIRGNRNLYPGQFSRSSTDVTVLTRTMTQVPGINKAGIFVSEPTPSLSRAALVALYSPSDKCLTTGGVGLATAWGSATGNS